MKKYILVIVLAIHALSAVAQSPVKFEFHGFIKTDYWWDTRQVAYAREGLFTLYPLDVAKDKAGNDIHGEGSFNFSAITSRANVKMIGQKAFGADVTGMLEADFSGMSNQDINGFRLRHAFINLKWKDAEFLVGQAWHPMFVTEVFPRVLSLNTGAPFQPFNRAPQARFTYHASKKMRIIAAALAQRDYASIGPSGRSFSYLSNSMIPNAHLQVQYKSEKHVWGIASDYKVLRPTLTSDSGLISNEKVSSLSSMVYYNYKNKRFQLRTKAIIGQNLADQLMLGGYAVKAYDTLTGTASYTPTNHFFAYANALYDIPLKKNNRKIRLGVFGGYAQNLGTEDDNLGIYYASGASIDQLLRGSANISYISGKVQFSVEWEHTVAHYGTLNAQGLVENTHPVANDRILFTGFYFF